MITPEEIKNLRAYAIVLKVDEGRFYVANLILKLLSEFERINRLGTEVREINVIYSDGTGEQLWPKKEVL